MEVIIPLAIFILLGGIFWLIARGMDTDRVQEDIEARGGKLLEKRWEPFGKGWFGDKSNRIYQVRYVDRDGNEHQATCKTSMGAGVYWSDDTVVKHTGQPEPDKAPKEANRRLQEGSSRPTKEET